MTRNGTLKRAFLITLIVALISSALVGIYAFLLGDFGEIETKILMTTLSISFFSVTSLACAAVFERQVALISAAIGLAVSAGGFLLYMPGIWAEWWDNEAIGKTMGVLAIFAFSFAQVCLLALPSLSPKFRWVYHVTAGVILALAAFVSWLFLAEIEGEWALRLMGVLGILDGCGSLLIPILCKLGAEARIAEGFARDHIELACPRCDHHGRYQMGAITCSHCALQIRVEILTKPKPVRQSKLISPQASLTP